MRQFGRLVVVATMLVGGFAIVPAVSASTGGGDVVSWGNVDYVGHYQYWHAGVIEIAVNDSGVVGLESDGTVVSGFGAADPPAGLGSVVKVAAVLWGGFLALKSDGTVVAWGDDYWGQTNVPAGLANVIDIAGGGSFSLALKSNGTVVAWGDDRNGQTNVPAGLTGVTSLVAGVESAFAIRSDGAVVAWGDDTYGETSVPAGLTGVVQVAQASEFTLALKSDGTVVAWGDDTYGTAVPSGLTGVSSIAAAQGWGGGMGFAVKSDGSVVGWGDSYDATLPPGLSGVARVASDGNAIEVLHTDGTLEGFGFENSYQMFGIGGLSGVIDMASDYSNWYALTADGTVVKSPIIDSVAENQPADMTGVEAISAGNGLEMALMGDGSVTLWGNEHSFAPLSVTDATQVAAGGDESYALKSDGTVVDMNTWSDAAEPPDGLSGVTAIAAGDTGTGAGFGMALKSGGTVVTWGTGAPAVPNGLTGVIAIAAGTGFCLALKSNSTVVTWGSTDLAVPHGLTGVIAIAGGNDFALALKSDGTVVTWGSNAPPVPAGLSDVRAIAAGSDFALALKSAGTGHIITDGTVVSWGDTSNPGAQIPVGLSGVTAITAGGDFASAIVGEQPAPASVSISSHLVSPRQAGVTSAVTVTVLDGSGNPALGYRGTVHFTSSDSSAGLPNDYSFTGADQGSHTFMVTLATPGTQSVTVADTVTTTLTSTQTGIVVHSPSAPGAPTAVRAMAANGAVFVAWTPPISTGGRPVTSYRVTSSPGGKTCTTVGTSCRISGLTNEQPYTFTVKATNSAGTGPAATSTTATPTTTTHLGVAVSTNPTVAGAGHSVTVTALDAGGNVATAYRGTVHFTSSDAGAGLPADYTFSATDAGVHKFTNGLALKTAGSQSVTVTDASSRVLGSVSGIVVTPGAMKSFGVALAANPTVAGAVHSVTVKALDAYGNVVPTYTGRIHFTSSDSAAVLPADYTFTAADKGAHKFTNGVTLETSGARLITVTDTVTAAMTGSESVTVTAAAAKTLKVSVAANPYVAGSAHSLTITALDTYGNVATGYRGKIHLTSSDSAAILPADYTFTATDAGVHKFTNGLTLKTAGARSVTATDKSSASITGSATVTVTPGAATTFSLSIAANPFGAGSAHSVTVKAFDACGNVATGYVGTIHFTSSDGAAVLPADYTFTGGDAGTHKFTNGVTLKTAGSQSVTATDTSHSSITGSQTVTVN